MRAHIKSRLSLVAPFRFIVPQGVIDVHYTASGVGWRWFDGTDYELRWPRYSIGSKPVWRLESTTQVYCGEMLNPTFADSIFRAQLPDMKWCGSDEQFHQRVGYCSGHVFRSDLRRAATWRLRWFKSRGIADVVYASPQLVPLMLGFVLATIYDPNL